MSDISIFNERDIYYLLVICAIVAGLFLTLALFVINVLVKKKKKFSYYILMYFICSILSLIVLWFLENV
ncbi:type IV secretory pathway component VirB8 [Chryseobacterium sp. W4I1]|nr:type IV secretory pathway component VirB8 [Chryseobacterium sp. W4I1]